MYPVSRFTLEFFRGDAARGVFFGISTSQLISVALFSGAILMLVFYDKFIAVLANRKNRKNKKNNFKKAG